MRAVIWTLLTAAAVALLVWIAPYYTTLLWWELRKSLFWLIPVVALLVVLGVLVVGSEEIPALYPLAWLVGLVGSAALLFYLFVGHSYLQDQAYARPARVTTDPVPALGQRAPYPVALAQARPNLGDTAGDIANTSYIPQTERFGTLVLARGWLAGYQSVLQQTIPLSGRGTGSRCQFDPRAGARVGGWWTHNLGRHIAGQARWLRFSDDDAYGFCDGDIPKVVVPLKRQDGLFLVTERPAGVAVYDGRTDQVTVAPTAAGLPGPSYPISLARTQRTATHALGGVWDYVFGRVGWETTDDAEDVNAGNTSEFVLPTKAPGTGLYVSQLVGRGSATGISAISTLDATQTSGQLAPLVVHRLDPIWVSTSAIAQRIQADYQDIPNWQNLKILEIAPVDGGNWVATIGNDQNILYRVTGTGTLQGDSPTCLYRGDGSRIRCGTLADQGGSGIGVQYGPSRPSASTDPGDLASLSNEQLVDLMNRAQQEMARRLTAPR